MDQIEPDALYDERVDVSRARPILQGDVFELVSIAGFDGPVTVQIVAHPCSMRLGSSLAPRVTVAPVMPHALIAGNGWNGNLRHMPMPYLADGKHYAARFVDISSCLAAELTRDRRIATLSHQGIYILQQRLIKHYTRLEVPLDDLRRQSAPTLVEAEIQRDWLEEVLRDDELEQDRAVDSEITHFEEWLRTGDPSPQNRLRLEVHHADVRREASKAAEIRSRQRTDPR